MGRPFVLDLSGPYLMAGLGIGDPPSPYNPRLPCPGPRRASLAAEGHPCPMRPSWPCYGVLYYLVFILGDGGSGLSY